MSPILSLQLGHATPTNVASPAIEKCVPTISDTVIAYGRLSAPQKFFSASLSFFSTGVAAAAPTMENGIIVKSIAATIKTEINLLFILYPPEFVDDVNIIFIIHENFNCFI